MATTGYTWNLNTTAGSQYKWKFANFDSTGYVFEDNQLNPTANTSLNGSVLKLSRTATQQNDLVDGKLIYPIVVPTYTDMPELYCEFNLNSLCGLNGNYVVKWVDVFMTYRMDNNYYNMNTQNEIFSGEIGRWVSTVTPISAINRAKITYPQSTNSIYGPPTNWPWNGYEEYDGTYIPMENAGAYVDSVIHPTPVDTNYVNRFTTSGTSIYNKNYFLFGKDALAAYVGDSTHYTGVTQQRKWWNFAPFGPNIDYNGYLPGNDPNTYAANQSFYGNYINNHDTLGNLDVALFTTDNIRLSIPLRLTIPQFQHVWTDWPWNKTRKNLTTSLYVESISIDIEYDVISEYKGVFYNRYGLGLNSYVYSDFELTKPLPAGYLSYGGKYYTINSSGQITRIRFCQSTIAVASNATSAGTVSSSYPTSQSGNTDYSFNDTVDYITLDVNVNDGYSLTQWVGTDFSGNTVNLGTSSSLNVENGVYTGITASFTNCNFNVDVSSVNYSPSGLTLSNSSIYENTATGTTIGTFSSQSADSSDTYTYSLVSGTGDDNNSSFTLTSGGTLKNAAVFNYETKSSYSIRVRTTDSVSQTYEDTFTIIVFNVNEYPTALNLSANSQAENTATGTTIGTFSANDPDANETYTYALYDESNYPDNNSFTLTSAGVLKNGVIFNYESKSSYTIKVRVTDAPGLTYDGTFTINVTNVNESPTAISPSSSSLYENVATGTTICTFTATDPENDPTTFELYDATTYPDNNSFTLTSAGVLKNAVKFNYEVKSSYSIRVRATDNSGLTYDQTITISISDVIISVSASATSSHNGYNISCNGGSDGVITVSSASGGSSPYTYSKDGTNYQAGLTFSSLSYGSYTIYAKDVNDEVGSTSVTVTQPTAISVSSTPTVNSCWTGSTAQVILSGSGGSGGYTYSINGGSTWTGATFTGLTSQSYTGYVKDSNGCTGSTTFDLSRTAPNATITTTNVTCYGGSNGSINVRTPTGGQGAPYSVKFTSSGSYISLTAVTGRTFSSLSAGSYSVMIKDSEGCEKEYTGNTVTQPTALSISASGTNPTCYDGSDGSAGATASGGTGTLNYAISSDGGSNFGAYQSGTTFPNLSNGSYIIRVKDSSSTTCTADSSTVTLNKTAPNATFTKSDYHGYNISCNGGSDGTISVTSGTGGSGTGYSASRDDSTYYDLPINGNQPGFSGLTVGSKTIYIQDSSGCVKSYAVVMTQPTALAISTSSYTPPTCWNLSDGNITLNTGTGGSGGYTYSVNSGGSYQESTFFGSLPNTDYGIRVKDSNGCVASAATVSLNTTPPNASISITNATACGNGSITVSGAYGGSGGDDSIYSASTDNSTWYQLPKTFYLPAGTYTIYIIDATSPNCMKSYPNRTIGAATALSITASSISQPLCWTDTGSVTVTATGGSGSYTYSANNGSYQNSRTFDNLINGYDYFFRVKDSNTCTAVTSNIYINTNRPNATKTATGVSCYGGSNGTITILNGTGGTGTITTSINNADYYSLPYQFTGFTAGNKTIYLTDDNGCTTSYSVNVPTPTVQTATLSAVTQPTCGVGNDGVLQLTSSGGTFPKTYRLYADTDTPYTTCGGTLVGTYDTATYGGTFNVTGLTSYGYCLEVTDANGCVNNSGVFALDVPITYHRYLATRCTTGAGIYFTLEVRDDTIIGYIIKLGLTCVTVDSYIGTVCSPSANNFADANSMIVWNACSGCNSGTGGGIK